MQIWKKDDKGRWLARQSHSLHQLHHRMSLAQFLLQQKRCSSPGVFVIFTEGEVDTLASEFNRYLVETKSLRWCRITKAVIMLASYVWRLNKKGIAPMVIRLPEHHNHDLGETFEIVPNRRSKTYIGIYISQ